MYGKFLLNWMLFLVGIVVQSEGIKRFDTKKERSVFRVIAGFFLFVNYGLNMGFSNCLVCL